MSDAPRLFLITPPLADAKAFAPLLEAALAAADVACVLIRANAGDEPALKAAVRALAPAIEARGAAALIEADSRLAARLDLDGVHVTGAGERLDEALAALKPNRIVGVGGLSGRDAAMSAGEAGVDYLMFGGPGEDDFDAVRDRVAWWAAIFNVPCVGYATTPAQAAELAAAGAEFIALGDGLWDQPGTIDANLRAISHAVSVGPELVP